MTNETLRDGLAKIRNAVHPYPEVISIAYADENEAELVITAVDRNIENRMRSFNMLFLELRRKVRLLTNRNDWGVRYASQLQDPLFPLLHSEREQKVIIDPMLPYRSPISQLALGDTVSMFIIPSSAHYFHTKAELEAISERFAKAISGRSGKNNRGKRNAPKPG